MLETDDATSLESGAHCLTVWDDDCQVMALGVYDSETNQLYLYSGYEDLLGHVQQLVEIRRACGLPVEHEFSFVSLPEEQAS